MSVNCVKGRIHDDHGYDRGICGLCSGAGCPTKKWKATFDASYHVVIEAQSEEQASKIAKRHWRRGFDFADLVEVKE